MSPRTALIRERPPVSRAVARLALQMGIRIRDERLARRLTLRELAARAGLSPGAVHAVESGRPASLNTYVRLCDALGLTFEAVVVDGRRARRPETATRDLLHAAMGELEVAHLSGLGFPTGVDEPYQHYQFAGRADVLAWDADARALLHIENRTRFPDIQDAAGAWNAKRAYLPAALAERLGIRPGWRSVTHVMAVLWSGEALHTLRLRSGTFRALCPDGLDAFVGWWSGSIPPAGQSSTLVVLDPLAAGRQRLYCGLDDALRVKPRHRDYAHAAERTRLRARAPARAQRATGGA